MFKAALRRLSLLAIIAGLGIASPVLASEGSIATPAWTNHALPLYEGPGSDYEVRGVLPGGMRVSVERCSRLWCHVYFAREHGYLFLQSLSFGHGPNSLWWPQEKRHPGVRAWPFPWGL